MEVIAFGMAQAYTFGLINPLLKALGDSAEIQILMASFMNNSKKEARRILFQSRFLALVIIFMPVTFIIFKSKCILQMFS